MATAYCSASKLLGEAFPHAWSVGSSLLISWSPAYSYVE
jgi:hypothetical protein